MQTSKTSWLKLVLVLTILGGALSVRVVWAQATGVMSQTVAEGRIDYTELVGGPTDVAMYTPTLEPGGSLGWHMHSGHVFVLVKTGEVTVYAADGCGSVYAAGSGFVMPPGEVMNVSNETMGTVELAATAAVPAGSQRTSRVAAPTATCGR
jgi:quercetin dioxygenase-like cupin family protein